ncbi:hypothetical protein Tco_1531144 [Tanacetum coccineum]
MAQQLHAADVHPDELCPPNKRYDLMDANKKIDFELLQCPPESKLLMNILKNHPLRFSIAASSSVPWIYMAQFWHTLNEDGSKIYNGAEDIIKLLDNWSSAAMTNVMQDIFQMLDNTRNRMGSTTVADNANDIIISHYMTNFLEISRRVRDRRSTCLTPPAPVPTVDKADEMILQDTLQNVIDDSSIPRNDDQNTLGTRLEPRSDKESPEVEITNNEEVEITNIVIPVNVNEEEEEIIDEVYELKRREKGKIVEESMNTPFPIPIRSPRIHTDLVSSDTEKLYELTVTDTTPTPSSSSLNTELSTTNRLLSLFKAKPARFKCYKNFFQELQGRYGYLFEHLRAKFLSRKSFNTLADHLQEVMVESLPTMVDKHIKEQVEKQVHEQVKVQVLVYVAKGLLLERQQNKEETHKMIAKAMLQERGKLHAKISSQI